VFLVRLVAWSKQAIRSSCRPSRASRDTFSSCNSLLVTWIKKAGSRRARVGLTGSGKGAWRGVHDLCPTCTRTLTMHTHTYTHSCLLVCTHATARAQHKAHGTGLAAIPARVWTAHGVACSLEECTRRVSVEGMLPLGGSQRSKGDGTQGNCLVAFAARRTVVQQTRVPGPASN